MFIAHAPSGYILSVSILNRMRAAPASARATILSGVVGAIAPDLDYFYFFLVDHRHTLHHRYISHWPLFWLLSLIVCTLWLRFSSRSKAAFLTLVFCAGGMLHVILDSIIGDVFWFAPFKYKSYSMFTLHPVWQPWWLNFVFHWTFALEIAICVWALLLYRRRPASREVR